MSCNVNTSTPVWFVDGTTGELYWSTSDLCPMPCCVDYAAPDYCYQGTELTCPVDPTVVVSSSSGLWFYIIAFIFLAICSGIAHHFREHCCKRHHEEVHHDDHHHKSEHH